MKDEGAWAFADTKRKRAERIHVSDRGLVYITGESVVTAEIRFTGPLEETEQASLFGRLFPLRVPFEVEKQRGWDVPFRSLIDDLDFIRVKSSWSSYLQGQVAKHLSDNDFDVIASKLGARSK